MPERATGVASHHTAFRTSTPTWGAGPGSGVGAPDQAARDGGGGDERVSVWLERDGQPVEHQTIDEVVQGEPGLARDRLFAQEQGPERGARGAVKVRRRRC